MIRHPAVSGRFYSAHENELIIEIKNAINHRYGPGKKRWGSFSGGIVPHAGYMFSGPCAANTYAAIDKPNTIVILGFSHHGLGNKLSVSLADWQTPLGICRTNQKIAQKIARLGEINESVHENEHSIEVQVPLIQYFFPDCQMVAVSVSDDCDFGVCGTELAKIDACFVASSDFTHYGASFHYLPFKDKIQESLKKLDTGAINQILNQDRIRFLEYINETGATICGRYPIALMIEIMKNKGKKPKLLKYYTSADVLSSPDSVSYVSIAYK